jgi:enterochelin esterase-like enzyme
MGQADRFSDFLKDELIPQIESEYSTDSSKYVLMGHSLGGLNTHYTICCKLIVHSAVMLQLVLQFGGAMVFYSDWKNSFSMILQTCLLAHI